MSVEEDVELRDLLAQTLDANGCLAKIKAQLRASIFLALDEDVKVSKKEPLLNNKVKTYLDTTDGQIMFCIVREFLEYFNLLFTMAVYEPESYLGTAYKYSGRQKISKDLGLDENSTVPILLQLVKIAQTKSKSIEINLNINGNGIKDESFNDSELETISNNKTEPHTLSSSKSSQLVNVSNKSQGGKLLNEKDKVEVRNSPNNTLNLSGPILPHNQSNEQNKTFELSSPSVALKNAFVGEVETIAEKKIKSRSDEQGSKTDSKENDDTYDDTSSIAEDSVTTSNKISDIKVTNGDVQTSEVIAHPMLKDTKLKDPHDKVKISPQKSEKVKSKGSLSSLTDLPPLQINKSRVSDILPSPYSKEFKEKSNLRELDKLFDMETEYEEDFMCSGDLDFSDRSDYLKSEVSKVNLLEDLGKSSVYSDKSASSSQSHKSVVKSVVKSKSIKNTLSEGKSDPENSTSRSISENLEYTPNVSE